MPRRSPGRAVRSYRTVSPLLGAGSGRRTAGGETQIARVALPLLTVHCPPLSGLLSVALSVRSPVRPLPDAPAACVAVSDRHARTTMRLACAGHIEGSSDFPPIRRRVAAARTGDRRADHSNDSLYAMSFSDARANGPSRSTCAASCPREWLPREPRIRPDPSRPSDRYATMVDCASRGPGPR